MLAVREPPPTFVVTSAVCIRDIAVPVDRREFHVVLVLESVARVTCETTHVENEAGVGAAHREAVVLGVPPAAVDVGHVDAHGGAVVRRELVHGLEAEPVFAGGISEAVNVLGELPVELDGAVVPTLQKSAAIDAPGLEGFVAWVDQVGARRAGDAGAVAGQLVHQVLVFALYRLQFLHFAHQLWQGNGLRLIELNVVGFTLKQYSAIKYLYNTYSSLSNIRVARCEPPNVSWEGVNSLLLFIEFRPKR